MNNSAYWVLILTALLFFSSILTVTATNPIFGSLQLILTYIIISLFLLLHEAEFFTIAYLIICAGGMGILFLFVVMTLPITAHKEKISRLHIFYLTIIVSLLYELKPLTAIFDLIYWKNMENQQAINYVSAEEKATNISELGLYLYNENPEIVIFSAILLFVALLGAIILTATQKK